MPSHVTRKILLSCLESQVHVRRVISSTVLGCAFSQDVLECSRCIHVLHSMNTALIDDIRRAVEVSRTLHQEQRCSSRSLLLVPL